MSCILSCIVWSVSRAAFNLQLNVLPLGGPDFKVIATGALSDRDIMPISVLTKLAKSL